MRKLIKNYIESYWWYFVLQSAITMALGLFALFAPTKALSVILVVVACALILMGLVGVLRMSYDYSRRPHRRWGDSFVLALVELALGIFFLLYPGASFVVTATVFGVVILVRGIFDLLVGLLNLKDPIDRFFWIVAGAAGVILGFSIFAHADTVSILMIMLLGTYMLILGLSNLFYGLHMRTKPVNIKKAVKPVRKAQTKAKK
ncbi:MAG: DUF308 domain-containing protein [Candidatus Nomurabacteria bacterium]|jgi:uncharacterized membrane protein HdeD (DUF308 family)|nr:DUF308 domain-containing protein [Candidatus Nomurabacteria bacterium]